MNKLAVAVELDNIFKLLKSCFDKDALLKLIAKNLGYNTYIKNLLDKNKIDYPTSFQPENFIKEKVKAIAQRHDEHDVDAIAHWVVLYLFHPESIKEKGDNKTVIQDFLKNKETDNSLNFPTHFYRNVEFAIKNYLRHEKTHSPSQRGEPDESGVTLQEKPVDVEHISDFKDLVESEIYKQYVEDIKKWVKTHGEPIDSKIVQLRFEDPSMLAEELADLLGITPQTLSVRLSRNIKKLFIDYALDLKKHKGVDDLYQVMKKIKFLPEQVVKVHGNITAVLEYMDRLESLI